MAKGGKRPGAGRPKGSINRPQMRDHFNEEEVKKVAELLKTQMEADPNLLKFVAEQLFGKAVQPVSGPNDGPIRIEEIAVAFKK